MTQKERLDYLINYLQKERKEYQHIIIPSEILGKQRLLRSLMNVRQPASVSKDFLNMQDQYLQELLNEKGVTSVEDLSAIQPGVYLHQGDITTLAADAIVNAANRQMLGCFIPCHGCVDNAIHTFAGIQLRLECARIMAEQGKEESVGRAMITDAYNLPCCYVLHTVGPIIYKTVANRDCELLSNCYHSCLDLAVSYGLRHVAFCCISTGEFHFPKKLAAEIAIQTVKKFQKEHPDKIEVIFNVFKDSDYEIYQHLLR